MGKTSEQSVNDLFKDIAGTLEYVANAFSPKPTLEELKEKQLHQDFTLGHSHLDPCENPWYPKPNQRKDWVKEFEYFKSSLLKEHPYPFTKTEETENGFIYYISVPGFEKSELSVTYDKVTKYLTVKGAKKSSTPYSEICKEFSKNFSPLSGDFVGVMGLITSKLENGVLIISVEIKTRKYEVEEIQID